MTLPAPTGIDALRVVDLPDPTPQPGEVLIEVEAATINPVDLLVVSGGAIDRMPGDAPWTPGWDLAGTVTGVGPGADGELVGRRVLGFSQWFQSGRGTQSSLVVLPSEGIAVASDAVATVELTTFGLNGLTALQALDAAGVASGGTVVVTGVTGAVGGFVSAFAVARGLDVIPVGRTADLDALRNARADAVITCAPPDPRVLDAVRDDGTAISVTRPLEAIRGIRSQRVGVRPDAAGLRTVLEAAERGVLQASVGAVYPVEQVGAAYRYFADRTSRDRVVLTF